MNEQFTRVFQLILENWQDALIGGIILVSAIIVIIGALKKFLINKISNKLVRKIVLAFSSVALAFPATAFYFLSAQINFAYYWYGCAFVAIATIIGYWLYENTGLRNGISYIGNNVIAKYASALWTALISKKSNEETKNTLSQTTNNLKSSVTDVLENSSTQIEDKDLADL